MKLQSYILEKIKICLCEHGPNCVRSNILEPELWREMPTYAHELPGAHLGTATQSCALIFDALASLSRRLSEEGESFRRDNKMWDWSKTGVRCRAIAGQGLCSLEAAAPWSFSRQWVAPAYR